MVGMATGKTEDQITEIAITDERWNYIDDFFKPNGSKKIMWYLQEPKANDYLSSGGKSEGQSVAAYKAEPGEKLFITDGREHALRGKAYFFIRLNTEKALTTRNMHETLFNQIDATGPGGALEAVGDFMKSYMLPHLRQQSNWGQLSLLGWSFINFEKITNYFGEKKSTKSLNLFYGR